MWLEPWQCFGVGECLFDRSEREELVISYSNLVVYFTEIIFPERSDIEYMVYWGFLKLLPSKKSDSFRMIFWRGGSVAFFDSLPKRRNRWKKKKMWTASELRWSFSNCRTFYIVLYKNKSVHVRAFDFGIRSYNPWKAAENCHVESLSSVGHRWLQGSFYVRVCKLEEVLYILGIRAPISQMMEPLFRWGLGFFPVTDGDRDVVGE